MFIMYQEVLPKQEHIVTFDCLLELLTFIIARFRLLA